MITNTKLLSLYQTFTKNTSTTNQTLGQQLLNDSVRTVCSLNGGKWPFLEFEAPVQTVANQEYVAMPNNMRKVISFRYVQGSDPNTNSNFLPRVIFDPQWWELVLATRLGSSDWPYYAYQQDRNLLFRPIPSTGGNYVMLRGRRNIKDMTIADYTTGTIATIPFSASFTAVLADAATSGTLSSNWTLPTGIYTLVFDNTNTRLVTLTNGSDAVSWTEPLTASAGASIEVRTDTGGSIITATGTTFTQDMVGRWLQITQTTASNGGDGAWYEIGNYYSATVIGLKNPYLGEDITAGTAAYTIGQCSPLPEAYQIAPVYRAAALYWGVNNPSNPNTQLANHYWKLYDGGVEAGLSKEYGGLISQMQEEANESQEGSYVRPILNDRDMYGIPYWFPWQNATGFN